MINLRFIVSIIGRLILIESGCFLLCMLLAWLYGEKDALPFLYSALITGSTGLLLSFSVRPADRVLSKKDGYLAVTLIWVTFSLFGTLPFLFGGSIPSFTEAFFETMSGFSTTGASVLDNIEAVPHATLFWRSLTQWLGGLGIAVLFLAVLPGLGIEGRDLYVAEMTGPTHSKMAATFTTSARRLWLFYVLCTGIETLLLCTGGMSLFDAACHSFSTMGSGGFSTKQASVAHWDSAYLQYIITFFMFVAGINYALCFSTLQGKFRNLFRDQEFRWYAILLGAAGILVAVALYITGWAGPEKCFRDALFQVVSMISSTGFATADYLIWPPLIGLLLLILMFVGGCAGSTAGGIKVVRIQLLFENSLMELKKIIHPNAVFPVKYNSKSVPSSIVSGVMVFFSLYLMLFCIGSILMSLFTDDMETACSAVISCMSNIGSGFGEIGPMETYSHLPGAAKWLLSFLMLAGRLEIFTVLVLFTRTFWKK
ncbi:MAG: TrkH family potassium uptake protein [Culturomica sp.]|jgi:trk system potassium uptake protein TrkH|nr:TrkH family potassium uptake protein [Culturomica sp.]